MLRVYLILLFIIIAFFGVRVFLKASPSILAKYARVLLLSVAGMALLYLLASGHLNGLFALLGVGIAFAFRLAPTLLRYAPHLRELWQAFSGVRQNASQQRRDPPFKGDMSVAEAYQVLGLKPNAPPQDIIAAHRKLMQKMHPDHGGSDYLAAKINLAKKVLLKK